MIGNIMDRVQRFYFLPKPYFRNSMLPHRECKNLTIEMGGGDSEHAEYILWCRDCDRKILNEFGLFFNDSYEGSYTPLSVPQHLTHHIPNDHEQKLDYLQNAWVMLEDSKEIEESNLVPYPQDDDFISDNSFDMLEAYEEVSPYAGMTNDEIREQLAKERKELLGEDE